MEVAAIELIDQLCRTYEADLRAKHAVEIKSFLARVEPSIVPHLLAELLLIKYEHDFKSGQVSDVDIEIKAFPKHRKLILECYSQAKKNCPLSQNLGR